MILRQTLEKEVYGNWDGGAKDTFDWYIIGPSSEDKKGKFTRIGSFNANHWFCVATGKTDKQTLSYAKKHLKRITRIPSKFEYIEEEN